MLPQKRHDFLVKAWWMSCHWPQYWAKNACIVWKQLVRNGVWGQKGTEVQQFSRGRIGDLHTLARNIPGKSNRFTIAAHVSIITLLDLGAIFFVEFQVASDASSCGLDVCACLLQCQRESTHAFGKLLCRFDARWRWRIK